jgi:precorrin-6B methylase 2
MDNTSLVGRLKQSYAATAQGVGRTLTKLHVIDEQPPGVDHRLRHWAYSLTRVHDSLAMARLDVPWWTYRAIEAVNLWLVAREQPARVFEYGSGASTIWLARRSAEVFSVEHHKEFADSMRSALAAHANVSLQVVEPVRSAAPAVASAKEGHAGLDFAAYVAAIDAVPGQFDLVVVDGRAREACLAAAVPRLAAGGVVVFDNSGRRRYRPAIEASGLREARYRGLTPTLPYPDQTSVLW